MSCTVSNTLTGSPLSNATRSRSASQNSISPRMARSVIFAISSPLPAASPSSSMTSSSISVESTSMTSRPGFDSVGAAAVPSPMVSEGDWCAAANTSTSGTSYDSSEGCKVSSSIPSIVGNRWDNTGMHESLRISAFAPAAVHGAGDSGSAVGAISKVIVAVTDPAIRRARNLIGKRARKRGEQ